jgi:hypothetical protein
LGWFSWSTNGEALIRSGVIFDLTSHPIKLHFANDIHGSALAGSMNHQGRDAPN